MDSRRLLKCNNRLQARSRSTSRFQQVHQTRSRSRRLQLSVTSTSPPRQGHTIPVHRFTPLGSAKPETCDAGFCQPVGSKIGYISPTGNASITIPATVVSGSGDNTTTAAATASKYLEIDYINNDIAFSTSWTMGSNSRNLTISVNGGPPTRIELPLSGKHSELFGPGRGW